MTILRLLYLTIVKNPFLVGSKSSNYKSTPVGPQTLTRPGRVKGQFTRDNCCAPKPSIHPGFDKLSHSCKSIHLLEISNGILYTFMSNSENWDLLSRSCMGCRVLLDLGIPLFLLLLMFSSLFSSQSSFLTCPLMPLLVTSLMNPVPLCSSPGPQQLSPRSHTSSSQNQSLA